MEQVSHRLLSGPLQADRVGGVQFWLRRGCEGKQASNQAANIALSLPCNIAVQGQPGTPAEQMSQGGYQAGPCSWDSKTTGVSHRSRNLFAVCDHHDISPECNSNSKSSSLDFKDNRKLGPVAAGPVHHHWQL